MRLFPPCEVITRRSGLRLLTIWGLGGGGGDFAGTTFPRLLPLETVRRPGEALALVYPLAAGRRRCEWTEINRKIKQVNADSRVRTPCAHSKLSQSSKGFFSSLSLEFKNHVDVDRKKSLKSHCVGPEKLNPTLYS